MLFNSSAFLFGFLPITYLVFRWLKNRNARYIWITISGYVFYGMWNYKFCFLMAFSTLVSYWAGLGLGRVVDPRMRRTLLVIPITIDLLLLGVFKYTNFVVDLVEAVASSMGSGRSLPRFDIVLPVGISFYTFHTITYIVDSYRGTIVPTRNFFEFSSYVSLFTQLVAGPIVRFKEIRDDLDSISTAHERSDANAGWSFFCLGLAKKVLVADTIALFINPLLKDYARLGTAQAWLCMLGYAYQLYFDFSGYSDMSVGLGHLFGLRIPQNFNSPYKALNVADFWRRWHISLSSCLRDYLYIPLGGRGTPWQTTRNLMMTMLLGGLWHGANLTFLVWGAYHGLLLAVYRAFPSRWDAMPVALRRGLTFLLVLIGWVFFRSDTLPMAWSLLATMFTPVPSQGAQMLPLFIAMIVLSTALVQGAPNTFELRHHWGKRISISVAAMFAVCLLVMRAGPASPFLYFQF